jgi:putative Mn2+ efflux pump MntP
MGLDIRIPIGLMFGVIGLMMTIYGAVTGSDAMYARSLGMNVNLWWGLLLLVFGGTMLWLGRAGLRKGGSEQKK